jgi:FAD/FMN-containing dehydrogenase
VPGLSLLTDEASRVSHGLDWTRLFPPNPAAVALPESVEQVREIVLWANEFAVPLVPSGGRTGLSGGAVAAQGEVVVSLERMHRLLEFDPIDRTLRVEAGMVTERLQELARERGLFYPVDFASRGSSQIGGNVATNAGGIKVLRYGMTRDWIAGLRIVTGAGEVLDCNRGLVKNASGYDLRHLLIGSEGTLGIVVEATVRLTSLPGPRAVMVLGTAGLEALPRIYEVFRSHLGLAAFECFSHSALRHVLAKGERRPFVTECPFYVLVEFDCAGDEPLEVALAAGEECERHGWVRDAVVGQSPSEMRALWRLREDITESVSHILHIKNDVSVRRSALAPFLAEADGLLQREYPAYEVLWFGHVGDGNLHLSVLKPEGVSAATFLGECERVSTLLFETVAKHGGSISAEHGVGLTKKPYLRYSRSAAEIDCMRGIKRAFDPKGILNPGKVFDLL